MMVPFSMRPWSTWNERFPLSVLVTPRGCLPLPWIVASRVRSPERHEPLGRQPGQVQRNLPFRRLEFRQANDEPALGEGALVDLASDAAGLHRLIADGHACRQFAQGQVFIAPARDVDGGGHAAGCGEVFQKIADRRAFALGDQQLEIQMRGLDDGRDDRLGPPIADGSRNAEETVVDPEFEPFDVGPRPQELRAEINIRHGRRGLLPGEPAVGQGDPAGERPGFPVPSPALHVQRHFQRAGIESAHCHAGGKSVQRDRTGNQGTAHPERRFELERAGGPEA
jgi:hypothetical protein